MKLEKGNIVLTVRVIESIYVKQIEIAYHKVQSSGSKVTRIEKHYTDLETDSFTRTIEEIEKSNIIGFVVTNEHEVLRVVNRILELHQRTLEKITNGIIENGLTSRLKRQLTNFIRAYEIIDKRSVI